MAKASRTKTTALHDCECSLWEFDLDVDRDDDYSTGCHAQTHRVFAQGHDAKLAGFLVRAELAGHDISKREGGMLVTFGGALHAAQTISEAFGIKVEDMLIAQGKRRNKKVAKVVEALATVTDLPTTRTARIKIGRWTYDATIDIATGQATYATKLGGTKTADQGTYSEV